MIIQSRQKLDKFYCTGVENTNQGNKDDQNYKH